jgi:hypothetical protein
MSLRLIVEPFLFSLQEPTARGTIATLRWSEEHGEQSAPSVMFATLRRRRDHERKSNQGKGHSDRFAREQISAVFSRRLKTLEKGQ